MQITRDWFLAFITSSTEEKTNQMVGRALVQLFARQTQSEKEANDTNEDNSIGFSAADAKKGSIHAKTFIKHKKLLDFQVKHWIAPQCNGYPRIAKYTRQLNDIANQKSK